jgi:hypothetical protein
VAPLLLVQPVREVPSYRQEAAVEISYLQLQVLVWTCRLVERVVPSQRRQVKFSQVLVLELLVEEGGMVFFPRPGEVDSVVAVVVTYWQMGRSSRVVVSRPQMA